MVVDAVLRMPLDSVMEQTLEETSGAEITRLVNNDEPMSNTHRKSEAQQYAHKHN
jgi:hypothetical protein